MSVWAASQPMRGQLLEKSLFRFVGTVCGTLVGMVLVQASPLLLVVGLALWVGFCTWSSNLQRGLAAYGYVLAGYSAAMVSLLATGQPDNVWHLGADRMATVLTGVVVATLIGYCLSKAGDAQVMREPGLQLLGDILRKHAQQGLDDKAANSLLNRLAMIDEMLEQHGAGSLRGRRKVRATRRLLLATVPLLLHAPVYRDKDRQVLLSASDALHRGDVKTAQELLRRLEEVDEAGRVFRRIVAVLDALNNAEAQNDAGNGRHGAVLTAVHCDWIGARQAGLRAAFALLAVGLLWIVSGWASGAYVLLGLSVMISVFSGFENPVWIIRHVFAGQCMAALAALACHILLWPYAQSELQQLLMMMPFILAGVLLNGHSLTFVAAMDFHMVFLLLSQPHVPYVPNLEQSIYLSFAVVSAPALAWGMYALVYPANVESRRQHVLRMMLNDLAALTKRTKTAAERDLWEARFFHRVLRFMHFSHKLSAEDMKALATSRAILQLSQAVLNWQVAINNPATPQRSRKILQQAVTHAGSFELDAVRSLRGLRFLAVYAPDGFKPSLQDGIDAIAALAGGTAH